MPMVTLTDGPDVYSTSWRTTEPEIFLNVYMLGGNDWFTNIGWGSLRVYMGDGNDYAKINSCWQAFVYGEAGNDVVDANLNGQFTFDGGDGDDRVNFLKACYFPAVNGGPGNDSFYGNSFAVGGTVSGGAGDDLFSGFGSYGGYTPQLAGGAGNDIYYVDPAAPPSIIEDTGEGTDTVVLLYASASYVKPANVENLIVQGSPPSPPSNAITGDDLDNVLAGTPLADSIYGLGGNDVLRGDGGNDLIEGGSGNDYLDGGVGADSMAGGDGDDQYVVDDPLDSIVDIYGQNDAVHAYVSYALGPHALVETMTTMWGAGTDPINLTGNGFGQSIYGNSGANVLDGGGGIDYLVGGAGNDRYFVDNARDVIIELADEGDDWVSAAASYTLGAGVSVETMNTADGAATTALDLAGNEFGQSLYGNAGTNTLSGNGGSDYLVAMEGNDVLIGGSGADYLAGGEGADTFFFSEFETGDRILDFASGADKLDIGVLISQSSFTFIDSSPFTGVAGQGRYAGGLFQLDVDGNGTPDFAVALNGPLTASDFTFNGSGSGGGFWDY